MSISKCFFRSVNFNPSLFFIIYFLIIAKIKANAFNPLLQAKLTHQIIDKHFDDCYVIKSRKQSSTIFTDTETKTPVIGINYNKSDHTRVLEHFSKAPLRHSSLMVKHNRQCIVYYISLDGFGESNFEDVLEIFQIKAIQIQATLSYLILSEFNNHKVCREFILSPKLKHFQHRMFVEPNAGKSESALTEFQLKRFCYFCANGNPDITQENQSYLNVQEITVIDEIFPDMTKNFYGKTMRVVAPPAPPLVHIAPSKKDPSKNEIYGQHAVILKSFAHHYNFTYSLKLSPLTGIKFPNGTWNGIMGEVLYDRADIGLSVATSYDRYHIVDFTGAVFYAFLTLVSTKPTPTFEWQAIFYPFEPNCWLAFIFSIALTFFVSKWIHNTSIKYEIPWSLRRKSKLDIVNKLRAEFMTNYKSFYVVVGNLLEQGPPFDFNSTSSRMFVTFWMFFAMIITTAYRSKLFTFLTFPTIEVPPSTFLELIHSSYKYGMKHIGGIAFVFITKSPLAYIRNIGEKMTVYNDKYSCLDRTFHDRFTCIIYRAYIDYMMETRYWKIRHNFHISDFVSPPVGSSWVFPKYAPWFPEFDRACLPIFEMGLAVKYLDDYQVSIAQVLREKARNSNSTQDAFDLNTNFKSDDGGPKPLVMANLYAAFFILIFGVAIGAILLALEVVRKNKYNQKLLERRLQLQVHLRRKLRMKKKELHLPKGQKLSLRQVVRVIGPNSSDILELERRPKRKSVFATVSLVREITHQHY